MIRLREMVKQEVSNYSMKLRLYPNREQREAIEKIFRALHLAYNITFHEVFQKNPAVCRSAQEGDSVWPDFRQMAKAAWRAQLCQMNPAIKAAPAASLMNHNGLFLTDASRAWQAGMHNRPVDPDARKVFRFYHAGKPRRSFFVQIESCKLLPSPDNEKVVRVVVPKAPDLPRNQKKSEREALARRAQIKARGFNPRLRFGENGAYTYAEALQAGILPKQLSARISRDTCGDYYISITFTSGTCKLFLETPAPGPKEPIGIDTGIKDIAVLNTGQRIENLHFGKDQQKILSRLNRKLSRRWGPANMAYRDYNRSLRQDNLHAPEENRQALAQPSHRYLKTKQQKALIERRITRRRNTHYHQQTAMLVRASSLIVTETLHVTNMMRNHKLARALSDAAMSDFVSKLRYKAERFGIPLYRIGTFEPTSQLCNCCGALNPRVKSLAIRFWICPQCGIHHDRDINAARNILQIGLTKGDTEDPLLPAEPKKPPARTLPRRRGQAVMPDEPDLIVVFSKELTRPNNPRYVIKDTRRNIILDDAQGAGYRSIANARNCFKAKRRWSSTPADPPPEPTPLQNAT